MDFKDIEKAAHEQSWRVRPVKKGLQFIPPDSTEEIVNWHHTPSDVRAILNFLKRLQRSGLQWPWPPQKGDR